MIVAALIAVLAGWFGGRSVALLPRAIEADESFVDNLRLIVTAKHDAAQFAGIATLSAAGLAASAIVFQLTGMPGWSIAFGGLAPLLLALAWIDAKSFLLPDLLLLPVALGGLVVAVFAPLPGGGLGDGAIAAVIGGGGLRLLRWAYLRFRKIEALGLGDVKLMLAAGFWIGFAGLPWVILGGAVLTLGLALWRSVINRQRLSGATAAPLGFGLCLAALVVAGLRMTPL